MYRLQQLGLVMADIVEIIPGVVFAAAVLAPEYGRPSAGDAIAKAIGSNTGSIASSEPVKPEAAQPALL